MCVSGGKLKLMLLHLTSHNYSQLFVCFSYMALEHRKEGVGSFLTDYVNCHNDNISLSLWTLNLTEFKVHYGGFCDFSQYIIQTIKYPIVMKLVIKTLIIGYQDALLHVDQLSFPVGLLSQ